ncbi:PHB depolymerase family esterase [Robiginitalea sp. M366]|uniref:carboxylesterase family protein n=1 Tax=Robiginitalea aestuariiviva TaxID=3036903 RepID=UPI00240DE8E3|nr:PHB depolymerase family esterase [Robiginitalea aestuariiviva]MDG1572679.1 PHB depolymerase family esterase [Robiginitalea aestuariiviva]
MSASRSLIARPVTGALAVLFLFGFMMLACQRAEQPRLLQGSMETRVSETLDYYLYFPPDYDPSGVPSGLLLFLHGGGESGQDLEQLKAYGPPKRLLEGPDLPFMVLAPQHPHTRQWWNTRAIKELLDHIVARYHVDPSRIYLSGLSRGATACWEMAVHYPDTFAAMAVVCGMTPVPYASWMDPELPVWVFHGMEDPIIPYSESKEMVEALQAMGRPARLTGYEGVGHNAWDRAYATDTLYTWLAAQRRSPTPAE